MQLSKLTILAAVLLAFMGSPALAQDTENVDTVILASTENYPDALMAASAANKLGVPILLTEQDELPEETRDALQGLQPSEIVVVGGSAVVSDAVVSDLQQDYNVTRLWGTTRYGTAVEVAEHFWIEGADEAILVQDNLNEDNGRLLAAAKELAREEDAPVYLTPEDSVPAIVQSSLEELGVQRVTLIGQSISDGYRSAITDLGITIEEEFTGADEDAVRETVRERVTRDLNASNTLVVVASESDEHAMAAANFPNSVVYHVTDEDETDGVVQVVNDHNVTDIKVVGQPDLAADVAEAIREQTDATVHSVPGGPREAVRMNANLTESDTPAFVKAHRERAEHWRQAREQRQEHIRQRVNHTIQKADELIDENSSEEAQDALAEARLHFSQGDYEEAWETAREAINEHREAQFRDDRLTSEERQRAIQEETEDLQERIDELQELNQEFAQEMQDPNMTHEERLEVIESFRHKRQEKVQALIEEARQLRGKDGDLAERLRDAEHRVRDRSTSNRFHAEIECVEEAGTGYRLSGHDGYVEARGTVELNNPNYDAGHRVSVDREAGTVDITVVFTERDGFGIECLAAAETRSRVEVAAGNWTVSLAVDVAGDEVYTASDTVTVTPDEDQDDVSDVSCQEDIEAAKEAAAGQMCTEQFQEMQCPHDDDVTYGAPDGCQISYLKEQGWTAADETETSPEVSLASVKEPGLVAVAGHTGAHPGYVVIHRDDNGSPGAVVGSSGLVSDSFETRVEYNSTGASTFWAMLHHDDGDGTYEFPGDDAPVTHHDEIVQEQFTEPEQDVMPASFTLSSVEDLDGCDAQSFYYEGEAVEAVTLEAGTEYTVTFAPREGCTYSGGAEYRSSPESVFGTSEAIQGGETASVTFTPEEDFKVTQYWPDSDISKASVAVDVVQ